MVGLNECIMDRVSGVNIARASVRANVSASSSASARARARVSPCAGRAREIP